MITTTLKIVMVAVAIKAVFIQNYCNKVTIIVILAKMLTTILKIENMRMIVIKRMIIFPEMMIVMNITTIIHLTEDGV